MNKKFKEQICYFHKVNDYIFEKNNCNYIITTPTLKSNKPSYSSQKEKDKGNKVMKVEVVKNKCIKIQNKN